MTYWPTTDTYCTDENRGSAQGLLMTLEFPRRPEIRLRNPPLQEVICQVRFPTILRIANEQPSEMQERVRRTFPHLEIEKGMLVRVSSASGPPSAEPAPPTYRFLSGDRATVISLTQDFYALSTTAYEHWQAFAGHLTTAHDAVLEVYEPAHAIRVGLRFVNRLTIENTQTNSEDEMLGLLRPELTALLTADGWKDAAEMRSRMSLPDGDAVLTLQTSFGRENNQPFFVIDFDYFEEGELPLNHLVDRCSRYQQVVYDAFRWCILERALDAFGIIQE